MNQQAMYQERLTRIQKAINLEPVDRIPVVYMAIAFSPRYMGMSMARFCTDPDAALEVTLAAMDRLGGFDGINSPVGIAGTAGLSGLWLSRVAIPGRELPEDSLWQIQEAEVMTVEDYDTIIDKGWGAFLAGYMPRVADVVELRSLTASAASRLPNVMQSYRDHGYVPLVGSSGTIPFEPFCGGRSMPQFFLDLYRRPDKVKAAMDVVAPELIKNVVGATKLSGAPGAWVGGWRAASALVAPKHWDRFVFPYFQQIVNALAENDIISILHLDQDWTRDLGRLRELPAKKCLLNPDGMTDVRKAKEILGDHMAILGDVPASIFAAGTPDDVYNYVRDLVRDVGPTGLLLCPGCDAPINTRPENMEAFVAASREYGTITAGG